jgi:hypothetical protein
MEDFFLANAEKRVASTYCVNVTRFFLQRFYFMDIDWRAFSKLIFKTLIVLLLLTSLALLLATNNPDLLFFTVIALWGIWRTRDKLLSKLNRIKVMLGVVVGACFLFGLLLWWLLGDVSYFILFVTSGIFIILLALGFYD